MLVPKRILVIRLDRLGDVILSTPVLEALRHRFPHVFIAMLVRPLCQDAIVGNPFVNDVLLYDKDQAQHGVWATIRFARALRRYQFDTALVLHPSNRSHWIPWLARIPVRIGYHRKLPWLLTHRLAHRKQEGRQHESAYTLEMLQVFGITSVAPAPHVTVQASAAKRIEELLGESGIAPSDRLVGIHPSASCISKRWLPERFADVADRLVVQERAKICVVAGEADTIHAHAVIQRMRQPALNLAGRLNVAELAALLRRCQVLISNDSGPVHVAAAVGTPVVAIFGRNQRGLSPQRWGPIGDSHVILHKEVGCVTCLAHACDIEFLCLTALTADEVFRAVVSVLHKRPEP